MQTLTVTKNRLKDSTDVLQRFGRKDKAAVKICIDNYGDVIWAMAKKFTDSDEDAEAVTCAVFLDIWRCAALFERTDFDELVWITIIARRQLRKYSEKNQFIN